MPKNKNPQEPALKEKKKEEKEPQTETPKPKGNGKKLLIVEDEKPLAHALELKFAHEGYETNLVEDGEKAMEAIKEFKPNGILLDLIMPKMDGFQFLEELKNQKYLFLF
jgi:CheY-like chemotaxis protein|tara:strand:+ start:2264 stop:2590 length:327 start_codon:yes stop_codon:yes gene_type:complete